MSDRTGLAPRTTAPPPSGGRGFRPGAAVVAGVVLALAAAPALAGDPAAGREKARQCQTCHGIDGLARIPEAPHIAGESELYITNQLEAFRSGRRTHPTMSVIAEGLSDADIADLAAWYASIEISVTVPE